MCNIHLFNTTNHTVFTIICVTLTFKLKFFFWTLLFPYFMCFASLKSWILHGMWIVNSTSHVYRELRYDTLRGAWIGLLLNIKSFKWVLIHSFFLYLKSWISHGMWIANSTSHVYWIKVWYIGMIGLGIMNLTWDVGC